MLLSGEQKSLELPLIKPSDAKAWKECTRRAWLDNKGSFEETSVNDFDQLLISLGLAHEKAVLKRLSMEFDVHKAKSIEDTSRLMNLGVDIIYQAQLLDQDSGIVGYPDFLIRHVDYGYQAADAKLSLNELKKEIQVQLGMYRRMLGTPLPAIVFLGDGRQAKVGDEANPITEVFVSEMRAILDSDEEPLVRYSHSKCSVCPYYKHCKPGFEEREELSLLYGIQGRAAAELETLGVHTISELAATDPALLPDIPYLKGVKKDRAVMQAKTWFSGEVYQTGNLELPRGTWVHFDIEDNPLTANGAKHVYLWGFLVPDYTKDCFEHVWTNSEDDDYRGWLDFLELIDAYRKRYEKLILAHYSQHERTTIKTYARRHGMEDHETVRYLLGGDSPLYDLQKPILENLVLPLQGYGLKDICKHPDLVNFQWDDDESGSQWSVVQFNRFLVESEPNTKAALQTAILGYNRDDVIATRRLEAWLRNKFE